MLMQKRHFVAGYRAFFAVLTFVAIIVQCVIASENPAFSLVNFLSYFTIESNVLAAGILLISAAGALAQKRNNTFALIRGAAVLYMVTTGIVYSLLLAGLDISVQTDTRWINIVLHYVMPIVLLADWLIDRPVRRIAFRDAAIWLVFPMLYLVYSLVRGEATTWYPYPFLNPANGGYGEVATTCVGIAAAIAGLTWLLAKTTRLHRA
jgi:hypothetical protein